MSGRKIIHVDMDAFYASIEQRDDPSLRGRPVIVGGKPQGRGVVCTASYEARKFGVRSAMPTAHAYRLCPQGIFVRPRFEAYKAASQQIRAIFEGITPLVEPLSLDEAYLDVTENALGQPSATLVAEHILARILEETGLTASAGVAPNKFLAKLGSDMNKPAGMTVIPPGRIPHILHALPVRRIHGVGRATEERLTALGLHTTADLRQAGEATLVQHLGRMGRWFYQLAHGIDDRPVSADRVRKSLGAERTFSEDLSALDLMAERLEEIAEELARRLARSTFRGRTLTLKVTYQGFERVSRSHTFEPEAPRSAAALLTTGLNLLKETEAGARPIRLLGLTLSNPIADAQGSVQLAFPFLMAG